MSMQFSQQPMQTRLEKLEANIWKFVDDQSDLTVAKGTNPNTDQLLVSVDGESYIIVVDEGDTFAMMDQYQNIVKKQSDLQVLKYLNNMM